MALFAEGKLFKVAGTGSGGGDSHNKGWFATQSALEAAYATAEAGDYAIVGSTDTVWIWDTDNSEWKDSDQKGQVTSVNGQTGDVVIPTPPTYTAGNSIDITNGVISTKVSLAQSPADTAVASIRDQTEEGGVMAIGAGASAANHNTLGGNSVAVGPHASAGMMAAAFGASTSASTAATAIGNYANASGNGVAVGVNTKAGNGAIVIGSNNADTDDRSPAGTMCVYLKKSSESEAVRYTLLEPGAFIPTARLTKVNTTATLAAADWSSNTQTVSVTGMTADGVVFVNPTPANQSAYTDAGILCTAQAAGSLTFTCDTVPSADIDVNVVCL